MTRRVFLSLSFVVLAITACRPSDRSKSTPDEPPAQPSPPVEDVQPIDPIIVFVQGSPLVLRPTAEAQEIPAEEGFVLVEGDSIKTDESSSVEIAFGSFATVRVFPSSEVSIRMVRSRLSSAMDRDIAELGVNGGAALAKVKKLTQRDEFLVVTPNSAAGVRGTQFLVRYEPAISASADRPSRTERTTVSVHEGRVALLAKGRILQKLLEERDENPVARAVVSTAFTFATSAGAGEEFTVGGAEGKSAADKERSQRDAVEAAYSSLLNKAEGAAAGGTSLDEQVDPRAIIAAPGSDTESMLRRAIEAGGAAKILSESNAALLEHLGRLRDPGSESSVLPAALPLEKNPDLKPKPPAKIEPKNPYPAALWATAVSNVAIVEPLTRSGSLIVAVDEDGAAHGINSDGSIAWSSGDGVVTLTALDSTIALSEKDGLSLVDGKSGERLGLWSSADWVASPRSKAIPVPEGLAVATPRGIAVLRAENASLVREIVVSNGIASTPVLADRELVAVSGNGSLAVIDLSSGAVAAEIPAGLGGDAFAPRYREGLVCAADRSGKIVAFDVASRKILWSRDLGVKLGAEPEVDADHIFAWTMDKSLWTLSVSDGGDAREVIRDADSAPLLSNGRLYWGSPGGVLVVADASTGGILKRIAVPGAQSVRPIMVGGILYVGTKNGKVVKIDPEK